MKCTSIRKEDDCVTVCVLCTLCHFWKSDYFHQISLLLKSLMPTVAALLFGGRWRSDARRFLLKAHHSTCLDCKYLDDGGPALVGPASLPHPNLFICSSCGSFQSLRLSCSFLWLWLYRSTRFESRCVT